MSTKTQGMQSYEKGAKLEREFADWMQKRLGYDEIHVRDFIKGKVAERSYEVDIHGIQENILLKGLHQIGLWLLIGLAVIFVASLPEVKQTFNDLSAFILMPIPLSVLVIFGTLALVLGYLGMRRYKIHTWVECKALGTNVKRQHMQKLLSSADDVSNNWKADWKPRKLIFVSAKDFDIDAINYAREFGVLCYRKTRKGFEKLR